jgi:phosphoglycolate phosphatase-like HAD superfamily hydrolase
MGDAKFYVWDLHGTLEQGNEVAVIRLSNEVLADHGFRQRFQDDDAVRLYGLKWFEYFKDLLPDEQPEVWYKLQDACFERSENDVDIQLASVAPTPNSAEVLAAVGKKGIQVLLSNTRPETLPVFVDHLGLARFFDDDHRIAVDGHSLGGRTKVDVMKEYLAGRHFDRIAVIGDSASDMKLGRAIGATCVLYNHPYLPRRDVDADVFTDDLRDVVNVLDW